MTTAHKSYTHAPTATPYTLGYKAAADGRDRCPYPLHMASNDQWWQGWCDYRQDAGLLPHQAKNTQED